jgi:TetR/AcrR family transcriptional regulator, transcriptional repressor for nem operon
MSTRRPDKRSMLVQAASDLVHRRGFNATTLADIAEESKVPLGNVYYYFKTKAAIGEAIVELRAGLYRDVLENWSKLPTPRERIEAFIHFIAQNRAAVSRSGCPIGTLCTELRKDATPSAKAAADIFAVTLAFLEAQFSELGQGDKSAGLAAHLLSALQGASLLAHSFERPGYLAEEAQRMKDWVAQMEPARRTATRRRRH